MQMNRRFFLHKGALAIAGTAAIPSFLVRSVMAEPATSRRRLVVVFQRGAADGLNIVVPYQGEELLLDAALASYPQKIRLSISMASSDCILRWRRSSRCTTRDISPSCTPPARPTLRAPTSTRRTTWRAVRRASKARRMAGSTAPCKLKICAIAAPEHASSTLPFAFLALGPDVPRTLAGKIPAIALNNVNGFTVAGRGATPSPAASAFEAMYADSGDRILHPSDDETFDAVKMLRAANSAQYTPSLRPMRTIQLQSSATQHEADRSTAQGKSWRRSRVH